MSELKLEVGKSYLNRKGETVAIVGNDGDETWPFVGDNNNDYASSGHWNTPGIYNLRDLISEVPCDYDFEMGEQHDDDAAQQRTATTFDQWYEAAFAELSEPITKDQCRMIAMLAWRVSNRQSQEKEAS